MILSKLSKTGKSYWKMSKKNCFLESTTAARDSHYDPRMWPDRPVRVGGQSFPSVCVCVAKQPRKKDNKRGAQNRRATEESWTGTAKPTAQVWIAGRRSRLLGPLGAVRGRRGSRAGARGGIERLKLVCGSRFGGVHVGGAGLSGGL